MICDQMVFLLVVALVEMEVYIVLFHNCGEAFNVYKLSSYSHGDPAQQRIQQGKTPELKSVIASNCWATFEYCLCN